MRIAFVTPELASATSDKGGLGSYVARVSEALRQRGHELEIFVPTAGPGGVSMEMGVRIERVSLANPPRAAGGPTFPLDPVLEGFRRLGRPRPALALAGAFERRDADVPFNAVELTNIAATGLYLPIRAGCRSILRLSCDYPTWSRLDGRRLNPGRRFLARSRVNATFRLRIAHREEDAGPSPDRCPFHAEGSRFWQPYCYYSNYGTDHQKIRPGRSASRGGRPPLLVEPAAGRAHRSRGTAQA